jgi:hypothetical protein
MVLCAQWKFRLRCGCDSQGHGMIWTLIFVYLMKFVIVVLSLLFSYATYRVYMDEFEQIKIERQLADS